MASIKMKGQNWPEKLLALEGLQPSMLPLQQRGSPFGTQQVEHYYKESDTSDINWLRYLFFIFDQNLFNFMTSV